MNGAWSRVDIYDGDTLIGTLGYNVIPGEADETDDLMAVYNAPGVSGSGCTTHVSRWNSSS